MQPQLPTASWLGQPASVRQNSNGIGEYSAKTAAPPPPQPRRILADLLLLFCCGSTSELRRFWTTHA